MEQRQYDAHIFEFVSNEHTRKNILLVGTKTNKPINETEIAEKIEAVKQTYGIDFHYLEKLV
ncbi:MAG: hypothetical protein A3K10_07585 [Bacteroidetes bacterium RIFCSPLOWO2_12_FULL_31_6]|nr:MAG: hypothetical protein A3K10_07585 [Bacteroidetes bacterium RIFCSPLOWO2_12_FULL_31_6]